jgi:transposase
MEKHSEVFIGLDVAKARHAVAVAEDGRQGEVRYIGEIGADTESVRRLVAKLEKRHGQLHFCYEAGPTGYGLHRQLTTLGYRCTVVAPSLIPRKPGDRVKTNRRDALQLARLLRAGELTAVWVPDEAHGTMRDLVRARQVAVDDSRRKRQAISSMMLRQGRTYPGKKTWGARHVQWLQAQRFDQLAQHLVLQEVLLAVRHANERRERIEAAIAELLPRWSLARVVEALQVLRGVNLVTAVTVMSEIGDLQWFESHASSWAISAWSRVNGRPATPCVGSALPRQAMVGCGRHWWRAHGATDIRLGPARPNTTSMSASHPRYVTSPPRRKHGSALGIAHCRSAAKS